ncbi:MAG: hypothetical protein O9293_14085 [Porphyrobacter sp.]|nr:hypothetical protein [Porphyrobacter sp.]
MRYWVAALLAGTSAVPVMAGETVLYDTQPAWVDPATLEARPAASQSTLAFLRQQVDIWSNSNR